MKKMILFRDICYAGRYMIFLYLLNVFLDMFTPVYDLYPRLDIPMHFAGGYITAFTLATFLTLPAYKKILSIRTSSVYLSAVIIVSFVASIAILWELYEFIMDFVFGLNMQASVFDTVKDMVIGLTGASIFAFRQKHLFLTKK